MRKLAYKRTDRIKSVVIKEVAKLLEEMNDPRATFVTITYAEITSDLDLAKIYYSVLTAEKKIEAEKMFEDAAGYIRSHLAGKLNLRKALKLRFIYDDFLEQAVRVTDLLDKIKDETKNSK